MYKLIQATEDDIDKIEILYNDLNDFLEANINYPGWSKDFYPTKKTAMKWLEKNFLYVIKNENEILATVAFTNEPEAAYSEGNWQTKSDYNKIIVIHTLAVAPKYFKHGLAKIILEASKKIAAKKNFYSVRLDVSEKNLPAISLYEKCGFKFAGRVNLDLPIENLKWFRLYEFEIDKGN